MDLRSFWKSLTPEQKKAFACAIGTSVGHVNNMSCGEASVSPRLAAQIELHSARLHNEGRSQGVVTRAELREDADEIWPAGLAPVGSVTSLHQMMTPPRSGDASNSDAIRAVGRTGGL